MPERAQPTHSKRQFTHVCLDCGALGYAGGYHDHGGDAAGDTTPLSSLPLVIRSFQDIETERDEIQAERNRYKDALARIVFVHTDAMGNVPAEVLAEIAGEALDRG